MNIIPHDVIGIPISGVTVIAHALSHLPCHGTPVYAMINKGQFRQGKVNGHIYLNARAINLELGGPMMSR